MAKNTTVCGEKPRVLEAQDSITRPSDTTQYTAGDGISDATTTATAAGYFTLDFGNENGGGMTLVDFTLHKSDHDVTTATFWLLLFDTVPALTGFDDNAALAITDAEMLNCKGSVIFAAADWINVITGDIQTVWKTMGYVPLSTDNKLYGILVAGDAYTPASAEVFTLTAHAVED